MDIAILQTDGRVTLELTYQKINRTLQIIRHPLQVRDRVNILYAHTLWDGQTDRRIVQDRLYPGFY